MKLLSRLLLCLLWLQAGAYKAGACIWYDGTTLEGNLTKTDPSPKLPAGSLMKEHLVHIQSWERYSADHLRAAISFKPEDLLERNDRPDELPPGWPEGMDDAVRLIFAGKAAEAVTRLTDLDRKVPENYWISANLAAACELSGDLPAAQRWVEKALAINPGAHEGTEWMHANVIRARLALEKDPAWLKTHTISGIPVEGDLPSGFTLTEAGQTHSLEDVHRALMAHTFARLIFVKPQDTVAASLLTELARVEARLIAMENGMALLTLAEEYGATGTGETRRRWQAMQPGPLRLWFQKNPKMIAVTGVSSFLILLAVLWYFISKRRARRHKAGSEDLTRSRTA